MNVNVENVIAILIVIECGEYVVIKVIKITMIEELCMAHFEIEIVDMVEILTTKNLNQKVEQIKIQILEQHTFNVMKREKITYYSSQNN